VIRAHREGILTSASLMIAGPAADEAIELARENPTLAIGLHLVVVDGPAALPTARIPHLVDADGRFPNQPVRLGLRYAFSKIARRELRDEIAAQFERFAATGFPLSHVDGHQHMHMHPTVWDLMLPLAEQFGAGRIRIVDDDLRLALRYDRRRWMAKVFSAAIFAGLAHRCRRRTGGGAFINMREPSGSAAGRANCKVANPVPITRTYGFFQSGNMTEPYVQLVLKCSQGSAEIYFHPTEGPRLDELGPNPGDLETLLSPAVRSAIEAKGLLPTTPADSASEAQSDVSSFVPGEHRWLPAAIK
jgi:hopanoid biosynthesis associated protein HpnK